MQAGTLATCSPLQTLTFDYLSFSPPLVKTHSSVPWTVCIRHPLSPLSAAVLSAHLFLCPFSLIRVMAQRKRAYFPVSVNTPPDSPHPDSTALTPLPKPIFPSMAPHVSPACFPCRPPI